MIRIQEITPIKLSGVSSLLVTFDYNPQIVNLIKNFQPAVWHKKILAWELPIIYLSKLLDTLTFIDDISLELLDETPEISSDLTKEEIDDFKYEPFKHQIEGINFLLKKKKALLLDSMGVGKSLTMMYLAETLHNRGLIDHCLLICGVDSLRSNWKSEITKFSKESVMVVGERINKNGKTVYDSIPKRVEQLLKPIDEFFVVMNIATLRDSKILDAIQKGPNKFGLIAVDEIHKIASKSSQQGTNLLELESEYKVAATGTPITNSPLSVYVPLVWTDHDHSTLTNYKSQYCDYGGFNNSQIVGYHNLDLLKDELDNCSIRRTLLDVKGDIPDKTIEYESVEMSDDHAKFYAAIRAGIKEEADKVVLKPKNLLAMMTRLRQATSAPNVLTTENITSSKVERAAELVEELHDSGEKVVVFCNFIETANQLYDVLSKFNPILCTGEQSEDVMKDGVDKFRNSSNFNVLIGTHGKMGTGFSMPECHYMIMVDTPYTYAQFSQSCDRIYRITSDQPVFIKVLTCKDTVDERIRHIIENKRDLSDFLIDESENPSFTDELRDIILNL